jgi:hypothetical protein
MTGGTSTFNQIEVTGRSIFNTKGGANVGIGTTMTGASAGTALAVMGGNVGIGSTSPGQMLDVQGTMRASGNVGIGSSITDSSGSARITISSTAIEVNLQ